MININNDWDEVFKIEEKKDYYKNLREFLIREYREKIIYPPMNEIFNAFVLTPKSKTKVIIVGQDPYHEKGQAMGLSFSVRVGCPEPASLFNIHKEILDEDVLKDKWSPDLTRWALQGVLLLNSTLTVENHKAFSHKGKGWEIFTDNVIKILDEESKEKVFILWGNAAREKKSLVQNKKHLILESAHPSPLSAHNGFFKNNHFKKCNDFLISTGQEAIRW